MDREDSSSAHLSVRVALLLMMSCACTFVAAALTWWAGRPIPEAVLAGLVVFAGAFKFFDSLIARTERTSHKGRE